MVDPRMLNDDKSVSSDGSCPFPESLHDISEDEFGREIIYTETTTTTNQSNLMSNYLDKSMETSIGYKQAR